MSIDQQLLFGQHTDPAITDELTIIEAFRKAAQGWPIALLDPNKVRPLLRAPDGRQAPFHKRVGITYRKLRAAKVLTSAGTTRSTDTEGRNAGRLIETYWIDKKRLASWLATHHPEHVPF